MQCQKLKTYMETGRVIFLSVKAIRPNPAQPRRVFAQEALTAAAGGAAGGAFRGAVSCDADG